MKTFPQYRSDAAEQWWGAHQGAGTVLPFGSARPFWCHIMGVCVCPVITNSPFPCSPQCTANGLCYEKVTRDGSGASSLEMLFSGFSRMVGLSLFPRLCQLTVVGQAVTLIQGLEACPLLQELWVAECQLTVSVDGALCRGRVKFPSRGMLLFMASYYS